MHGGSRTRLPQLTGGQVLVVGGLAVAGWLLITKALPGATLQLAELLRRELERERARRPAPRSTLARDQVIEVQVEARA